MKEIVLAGAISLLVLGLPQAAPAKSAAEIRRDREIIRQMNERELARVRRRDARYAADARASRADRENYAWRRAAYERDMAAYARQRRQYRARMAAWRQQVADCNAGVRSACGR